MQIQELNEVIEAEGYVYKTTSTHGDPVLKSNPAVAMRSTTMSHLHSLLSELGLTPSSPSKVGCATGTTKKKGPNGFLEFT